MFGRTLIRHFSRLAAMFGVISLLLSCNIIGSHGVDDAKFIGMEISTPADDHDLAWLNNARSNTDAFFRISFSTTTDIYSLVEESDFHASFRAYLCRSGKVDTTQPLGIDSNIYNDFGDMAKYSGNKPEAPAFLFYTYHVYVRVPTDTQMFDSLHNSDICIVILGGQMVGAALRSDPIVVPAALIREAIYKLSTNLKK